jgi:hypothetical protein
VGYAVALFSHFRPLATQTPVAERQADGVPGHPAAVDTTGDRFGDGFGDGKDNETAVALDDPRPGDTATEAGRGRRRARAVAGWLTTVLALLLVWFALVGPDQLSRLSPEAFVRIPIEALILVAVALVLPRRARRIVAAVVGTLLGLLTIVKIIDMGFFEAINRPFNPTADWSYFQSAEGLLSVSIGRTNALVFLIAAAAVGVAVLIFTPLAVIRLTGIAARHRTTSIRGVAAFTVVWVLCAVLGAHIGASAPIASTSATSLAYNQVRQVNAGLHDKAILTKAAADDPYRSASGSSLLTGLRGKDVIIDFVESYGQVAVQGSSFSPQIDSILNTGTKQLSAAGFSAKSAFLTSPTFGGISWLAHATLQSGLEIDNQQSYNDLVTTDRFTLSDAFQRAGWRTVADVPSNEKAWPEGKTFYHYDQIYDGHNVGYHGPNFSYAAVPDQYTYAALQRLELAKPNHAPVMAEIDTVSSHTPWAPLPRMVDPSQVGDGSVFNGMPAQGQSPTVVWRDANKVRAAYAQSIQYSLNALISFVQTSADKNLVLIVLGDHQPATIVSGQDANHDVPITIIAHDPAVLKQISAWHWQNGLLPSPSAPVWPMNAFRDRFLTAYGP